MIASRTIQRSGSANEPVSWPTLVDIFDSLIGRDLHHLPEFPAVLGHTIVTWTDANGTNHKLEHLDDLREPYEAQRTGAIKFVRMATEDGQASFEYFPGDPRPRSKAFLVAQPEGIESRMSPIEVAFPLPFEGSIIFLSWGGELSRRVASVLQVILESHFPSSKVFFSPESIDIGDDPMTEIFERHLLQAQVLVAVLTMESASRPWLIWETATTWAKGRLVAPIHVDIEPENVPGPLSLKRQGAVVSDRADVDRVLAKLANAVNDPAVHALSDDEWRLLSESCVPIEVTSETSSDLTDIPARFAQRTVVTSNGNIPGTLLAVQVTADAPLDECAVLMTSITGPPGAAAIPAPARLRWYPSVQILSNISQGASDLINLANVGPFPPCGFIASPDHELPWVLENGAWRIELQITARGFLAQFIDAAFNVHPTDGIPNQRIEWTELTVRPSS